ncbi:hypothetical protein SKAU_G00183800 [Synaphobranchus kaupii]|uniref:C2 domain-containing protein n=1 Tax=Synaphobranchus kaupii TaxID=118154 RepID=A0A9Q1IW72_SYNKA|nr:hypothetical protein SKAU_G00183800 [Synaphobranchus kaupii]
MSICACQVVRVPSLPELLWQLRAEEGAESSQAGTDDDTSPGAELHLETRGSVGSVSVDLGILNPDSIGGEILLALGYNLRTSHLEISVKACKNLPYGDAKRKKCHPYVKMYLLPDCRKLKTAVKRNTTDPVFNQTLEFEIERPLLAGRILQVSVWHSGTLKRKSKGGPATRGPCLELRLCDHAPFGLKPLPLGTAKLEEVLSWQRILRTANTWHDFSLPFLASDTVKKT